MNQVNLLLNISANFGKEALAIHLDGHEACSTLFEYNLKFISPNLNLVSKDVLGKFITLEIYVEENNKRRLVRTIQGIVTQFKVSDSLYYTASKTLKMRPYRIKIQPQLYLLSLGKHSRVFQKKEQTVLDIVQKILKHYQLKFDASNVNAAIKKEYCLQYQESDYDFIYRLLAEAGIYFYFKHEYNQHILILSNQTTGYLKQMTPRINPVLLESTDIVPTDFSSQTKVVCTHYAAADFSIESPHQFHYKELTNNTLATSTNTQVVQDFSYASTSNLTNLAEVLKAQAEQGMQLNEIKLFAVDYPLALTQKINLANPYTQSKTETEHVVIRTTIDICDYRGLIVAGKVLTQAKLICQVATIPAEIIWRPKFVPHEISPGIQMAVVVGAGGKTQGNSLHCDEYGRVLIKYVWEDFPANQLQEASNYWDQFTAQISHAWDNGIYRVGTPVLVSYLYGDLDRPIIIGSANQADNLPLGQYDQKEKYNHIIFDDQGEQGKLMITAVNQLITTAKQAQFNSKNHESTVEETYKISAKDLNYQAKTSKKIIDNQYELSADKIILKGDVTIEGKVILKGSLDIS